MSTYLLNRAVLNRNALDDDQRKAMFARLGGHGGGTSYGGSASKAHDAAFKDKMAKAWDMGFGLGKDMVGGIAVAEASGVQAAAAASRSPLLAKFRDALRHIADEATDFQPTQKVGTQARRNELAAALRRDRELKRMDLHPEQFRTTQPFMSASERQLRSAAARNPSAPAAEFGYMGGGTIGERVARIDREAKAYSAAKATARGHRPGETLALYGNRMPPARSEEERQRRAFFAKSASPATGRPNSIQDEGSTFTGRGPTTVSTVTTRPGQTITRTTETGFPRAPVRQGSVGGGQFNDRLQRPGAIPDGSQRRFPEDPRQSPLPPDYPVQSPQETDREYRRRAAEYEKNLGGDYSLRPMAGNMGGMRPDDPASPGYGRYPQPDANKKKIEADKIMARAAAKRKQAQGMYPGALQDTGESSFLSRAQIKPASNSPLARFLALPTLRG